MLNRLKEISHTTLAAWAIPLAVLLFFCVNLLVSLTLGATRIDLTQGRIYTVSDATREVLDAVTEPVTLRLYQSSALIEEAPELRVYSDRVTELLRAYEQYSDGLVRVEIIDPLPFSAAEDRAIGHNLAGFNLSRSGERGYFGLVGTNTVDQLEVIEALSPVRESYLEYELTRMVLRLSHPSEPRIGVIDGLELFGNFDQRRVPSAVIERLSSDFELIRIPQDTTSLPDGLDALVVIHPHSITPAALYLIDQYVLGGGPALVFLDVLAEHSTPNPANASVPQYPDSTLEPLLAAWGLSMNPQQVVGDISMALQIRAQAGNQLAITEYPPWLIVDEDNLRDDDMVTGRLSLMRISSAGALVPGEEADTSFTPLIETTPATMLYDQAVLMRRNDPRLLVQSFQSSETVRTLAARVSGPVRTAFPDGPPPEAGQGAGELPAHISDGPINAIIVSDTDLLADNLNVGPDGAPTNQNTDFVINALDSLVRGGVLNELRARGLSFRPFTLVNQIEAEADARYRATEQQLQAELLETEDRLAQMRRQSSTEEGRAGVLSREQQQTVAEFNRRIVEVREELRAVQAALRRDIENLVGWLRLVNILAVPLIVVLAGVAVWLWRRIRVSRYLRKRDALTRE